MGGGEPSPPALSFLPLAEGWRVGLSSPLALGVKKCRKEARMVGLASGSQIGAGDKMGRWWRDPGLPSSGLRGQVYEEAPLEREERRQVCRLPRAGV